MTPNARAVPFSRSATTSGVPPSRATRSTVALISAGAPPPCSASQRATDSPAPLRSSSRPAPVPTFTPLMRVLAENGTNSVSPCPPSPAPTSRPRRPYFSFASTTTLRPSGVSSASDESCARSARYDSSTPGSA